MFESQEVPGIVSTPAPVDFPAVVELYVSLVDDPSALHSLVDELDTEERRQLIVSLLRIAGLLELKPPGVDTSWYLGRMVALSSDFTSPWSPRAGEAQ